ncbi:hypothetical protein [Acidomonas methanolica]|uniref:hypothetical protein n=1 Tax=Acidomonas methanolica TaxID=437 RepID=UPI00211A1F01|nr:hypothetical protein [Acidomonas methanolica]MCQ9154313.1 hypothetical protein [Acidomonas methanolica]
MPFESDGARSLRPQLTLDSGFARWTAGDALLPLYTHHPDGVAMPTMQILAAGPYQAFVPTAHAERRSV